VRRWRSGRVLVPTSEQQQQQQRVRWDDYVGDFLVTFFFLLSCVCVPP
jgi:hypothetical protein